MMVGELNYQNNILDPYLKDELPFSFLTYLTLVNFIVVMPILLVNLMVSVPLRDVYFPVSLLTFGCSIDWFSSWGHR